MIIMPEDKSLIQLLPAETVKSVFVALLSESDAGLGESGKLLYTMINERNTRFVTAKSNAGKASAEKRKAKRQAAAEPTEANTPQQNQQPSTKPTTVTESVPNQTNTVVVTDVELVSSLLTDGQKSELAERYGVTAYNAAVHKWEKWKISNSHIKNPDDFKGVSKILRDDFTELANIREPPQGGKTDPFLKYAKEAYDYATLTDNME